jgi:enoyl-CoA hydratase
LKITGIPRGSSEAWNHKFNLIGVSLTRPLPRLVGKFRAMTMILTGEFIDAATAHDWGLAVEVTPAGQTAERALEIACTIAQNSPVATRMAKAEVLMSFEKPLDESLSM